MSIIKNTNYSEVNIHNQNFASVLLANNNPNQMFLREAVVNSIEAMVWYLSNGSVSFKNPIQMYIRALPINDLDYYLGLEDEPGDYTAPKLSFLNLKGLTADQLEVATSMTGSVDKEQDLDANFGIGIISSVTSFSDLMMISRYNGVTHATTVGFRNGNLVRILPVTDVTEWAEYFAEERGYDRYGDADFTEVIILGHESERTQNTFLNPYSPKEKMKDNWLVATLYTRIARMPENIELILEGYKTNNRSKNCKIHMSNSGTSDYTFRTWNKIVRSSISLKNSSDEKISKKYSNFEKETVTFKDGTEIDYIYDGPSLDEKSNLRPTTVNHLKTGFDSVFSALEFQGEYFDIYAGLKSKLYGHFSGPNKTIMTRLGVIEGSEYFRIIYRLPSKGLKMNFSRTYITEKNSNNFQHPINLLDKISEIYNNRPDWFIEKISEHNTNVSESNFENRVRDMLKDFFSGDSDVNLSGKVKGEFDPNGKNTGKTKTPPRKRDSKGKKSGETKFTENKNGSKEFRVGVKIPVVKFVSTNKTLGSDLAEYKISEDLSKPDEIILNENHKIITSFASKFTVRDDIFEKVRLKSRDLIAMYLSYSCAVGLVHKNKARGMFSFSDFQSWVSNPSLGLKAKEGKLHLSEELKKYTKDCEKEANQSSVVTEKDNLKILNQRELARSIPNKKGELVDTFFS